jgi:hypothetical protein
MRQKGIHTNKKRSKGIAMNYTYDDEGMALSGSLDLRRMGQGRTELLRLNLLIKGYFIQHLL